MNVPGLEEPFSAAGFRRLLQAVRELATGGTNAANGFTLAAGQTQTVVIDRSCKETSLPVIVPCSAASGGSGWWLDKVERGQFTIGHAAAPAGAAFRYELRQP